MSEPLAGTTAVVTGAAQGFGRAIAASLIDAGATVIGIARGADGLSRPRRELGERFVPAVGDASDPVLVARVLADHRPTTVVLNAGASPACLPLHHQTWETFSAPWDTDVRQAFHWCRQALLMPLAPGSTVIAFSSGAALQGSPLSGGYAGAKATVRFIAGYAADESRLAGTGIRFLSVLPKLTPDTGLGAHAVAAYAARDRLTVPAFLERLGPTTDARGIGEHVALLAADASFGDGAYLLPPEGGPQAL